MKRNMSLVAVIVCICSVVAGIYYTDIEKSVLNAVNGRRLIETDFLGRFEFAYGKDKQYFQKLGISRIQGSYGLTFQKKENKEIIVVEKQDVNKYMIGYGIKDGKPQVKYLNEAEANKFFDDLIFPNIWTRAYKKWRITSKVFEIVGEPGY